MKILILLPEGQLHRLHIPPFIKMSFREAPLTATALAALVPAHLGADIRIVDESVSPLPPEREKFDLVAISAMTGTSTRAYQLADYYRNQGSTVVIGGVHVTLLPDEAAAHADAIVIGFAEESWPRLLTDFAQGHLQKVYRPIGPIQLTDLPLPRRDLQKKLGYAMPNTVWATRGCRLRCDFCSVVAAGFGFHKRPIGDVVAEVGAIKSKRFAFNDVNLTDDLDYAKELCRALIPLRKAWGGLATTRMTDDEEMLELLERAGCNYLLLGFESLSSSALASINKKINTLNEYKIVVDKLHRHKIIIQGCFIFGIDGETADTFAETVDTINELKIDIPRYALYTPYPGTECYQRMEQQGRLLHKQWQYYDTQHVVIQPDRMTPAELDAGFQWAIRETFKIPAIRKRLAGSGSRYYIGFVGNLAYRLYARRISRDTKRFPQGLDAGVIEGKNPDRGIIVKTFEPQET